MPLTEEIEEKIEKGKEEYKNKTTAGSWRDGISASSSIVLGSSWSRGMSRSRKTVFSNLSWKSGLRRAGVENTDEIPDEVWKDDWEEGWSEYINSEKLEEDAEVWSSAWTDSWREYQNSEKAERDSRTYKFRTDAAADKWETRWKNSWGDANNWDV